MVMQGRGSDWAWLALSVLGADATVGECNRFLASVFVEGEDTPDSLVDAKAIEDALRHMKKRGMKLPGRREVAARTIDELLSSRAGRDAIRARLRRLTLPELTDLLQTDLGSG